MIAALVVARRAPAVGRRGDPLTAGRCPGPFARRALAVARSSAGTVLVIHNDGHLRIGTVLLAVP